MRQEQLLTVILTGQSLLPKFPCNGILLICELALVLVGRRGLRLRAAHREIFYRQIKMKYQQQSQTITFLEQ